jgi:hypothetical protein
MKDMLNLREKIYKWLAAPDPSNNFLEAERKHLDGTGMWFINSPEFKAWKEGVKSHLWIYGISKWMEYVGFTYILRSNSGFRKVNIVVRLYYFFLSIFTVTNSSTIITRMQEYCTKNSLHALAYFFFDSRDGQRDFSLYDKVLRSLIKQLLEQYHEIPLPMLQIYNNRWQSLTHRSLCDLINYILAVFDHVYIILDALDECGELQVLLKWIKDLAGENNEKLHFLGTTRPEKQIPAVLDSLYPNSQYVNLSDTSSNDDIQSYIRHRVIQSHDYCGFSEDIKETIMETIAAKANGM